MSKLKAHIYVLIATILISGSFIASNELIKYFNPVSLTFIRFLISVILVLPIIIIKKISIISILKTMPRALIISFFYAMYFLIMFKSLEYTSVTNAGTIYILVPLIAAIFGKFLFKEKLPISKILIYIFALLGAVWIIFEGKLDYLRNFALNKGDYLFLVACFSICFYSIAIKILYRNDDFLTLMYCTLIGGLIWMLIGLYFFNLPIQLDLIGKETIGGILYLTVGTTIVTVYLYQNATVVIGPSKIMSYIYLNPVFVVVMNLIYYKQDINVNIIPALIITTLATVLIQIYEKKK